MAVSPQRPWLPNFPLLETSDFVLANPDRPDCPAPSHREVILSTQVFYSGHFFLIKDWHMGRGEVVGSK